ncbi:hypothetical protein [Streptomyces sp. NPDC005476]|uniref:hypothetical protein n=1 Tax=Streptomyces sp. NPDC005476 TaxID=3156882 RepID=UPI003455F666
MASGITVSSALPYILPVTAWLLKVAAERLAGQAVDALGDATREKIARLVGRRGCAPGADGARTRPSRFPSARTRNRRP